MSWKDCAKQYIEKTGKKLTDSEIEVLRTQYGKALLESVKQGKKLDSVVGNYADGTQKTFVDDFFDKILQNKILAEGQQLNADLKTTSKLVDFEDKVAFTANEIKTREPNVTDVEAQGRALIGSIITTNDTTGHLPLDFLQRSEISNLLGDYDGRISRVFPEDFDYDGFIKNKDNAKKIYSELFEMEKRYAKTGSVSENVKSITGDLNAFKIAEAVFMEVTHKGKRILDRLGKVARFNRLGLKIRYNRLKVTKMGSKRFVDEVAPRLDESVHGDLYSRQKIAQELYEQLADPSGDWRTAGVKTFDDANQFFKAGEKDRGLLVYKDGESFGELISQFSDDVTFRSQLATHITETGKTIAKTKMFGPSDGDAAETLRKLLKNQENNASNPVLKAQLGAVQSYLEDVYNPRIRENTGQMNISSTLRNLQAAAKLGSAVITAILDIPTFIVTGKRLFNLPIMDLIAQATNTLPFRGSPVEQRNFARYVLEIQESYMDDIRSRFFAGDGINNTGIIQRGASGFATGIFKLSGLNWWTRTLQSSAAGVYSKHLGELISSRTVWANLGKDFKFQLNKFGITEQDWNVLLKNSNNILDGRGRLDMYKLGNITEVQLETGATVRNKITAAVADAVDTMVMKPSEFDKMSAAFFQAPEGFAGSIFRVLTQFKAHPISYTRKTLWRSKKQKSALQGKDATFLNAETIQDVSFLMASLTMTGAVVIQLKEFIAGRNPYKADNPELYVRAFREGGGFGLLQDLFMQTGGTELLEQIFADKKVRFPTSGQIAENHIGPLLGDALKIMATGFGVGKGAILQAKGLDDGEFLNKRLLDTTKMIGGYTGLQRLWWTKMLYRKYVTEYLTEMMDPAGYRRRERKAKRDAINARYGNRQNNILFDKLLPDTD
tara:strand:- start:2052 stop:4730 length:2679 start_codon:yes stop_codon:yes gene_type:complete